MGVSTVMLPENRNDLGGQYKTEHGAFGGITPLGLRFLPARPGRSFETGLCFMGHRGLGSPVQLFGWIAIRCSYRAAEMVTSGVDGVANTTTSSLSKVPSASSNS